MVIFAFDLYHILVEFVEFYDTNDDHFRLIKDQKIISKPYYQQHANVSSNIQMNFSFVSDVK